MEQPDNVFRYRTLVEARMKKDTQKILDNNVKNMVDSRVSKKVSHCMTN